jgi:hypothetical protein
MTVSPLLLAILAMDSYNRGYDEGITGLGGIDESIGEATLIDQSIISPDTAAVNAGFYAAAYTVGNETVISYRGTDDNIAFNSWWSDAAGSDLWNGYGTSVGSTMNDQAHLAAEFYQAVTGTTTTNPATASVAQYLQSFRRNTLRTAWSAPLRRTRSARGRVGRTFSRRFTRLMVSQMRVAVSRVSRSE